MTRKLVASLKRALLDSKRYGLQRLFPPRLAPLNISPKWTLNEASSASMLAFRYGMILRVPQVRKGRNVSERVEIEIAFKNKATISNAKQLGKPPHLSRTHP